MAALQTGAESSLAGSSSQEPRVQKHPPFCQCSRYWCYAPSSSYALVGVVDLLLSPQAWSSQPNRSSYPERLIVPFVGAAFGMNITQTVWPSYEPALGVTDSMCPRTALMTIVLPYVMVRVGWWCTAGGGPWARARPTDPGPLAAAGGPLLRDYLSSLVPYDSECLMLGNNRSGSAVR